MLSSLEITPGRSETLLILKTSSFKHFIKIKDIDFAFNEAFSKAKLTIGVIETHFPHVTLIKNPKTWEFFAAAIDNSRIQLHPDRMFIASSPIREKMIDNNNALFDILSCIGYNRMNDGFHKFKFFPELVHRHDILYLWKEKSFSDRASSFFSSSAVLPYETIFLSQIKSWVGCSTSIIIEMNDGKSIRMGSHEALSYIDKNYNALIELCS